MALAKVVPVECWGKKPYCKKKAEEGESREATVFVSVWCVYGVAGRTLFLAAPLCWAEGA